MKTLLLEGLLLCLFLSSSVLGYKTRNVVILVIDGSRYTETFGDSTHQYIPFIWNKLRPLGTIYTKFYNDSMTITCSGHSTILTGAWQKLPNDGSLRPEKPTIYEYYRKQLGSSEDECAVILGKDKLSILSYSTYSGYGEPFGASVLYGGNYTDDINTWNNTREILSKKHPRLAIVNLGQVDAEGHSGNWDGYVKSIQQADSIVYLVWDLLQNDPFYKDSTTLFVVNDHGRHTHDFTSHGCHCEGCRHLLSMMIGPDTKAGKIDSTYRQQIDIAPTIGQLLGFSTPISTGHSLYSTSIFPSSSKPHRTNLEISDYSFKIRVQPGKLVDINFELNTGTVVSFSICDLQGKLLWSTPESYFKPGPHKTNISYLPFGNYLFNLKTENNRINRIVTFY